MNRSKIEYCDYVINPIIGCKHNCWFCYAKRLNDRFKWIPDWTQPQLRRDWLRKLKSIKKPSIIFIGSMTDLFGEWVADDNIQWVIDCCRILQSHRFLFLTKNPVRYASFEFPNNCFLGATITCPKDEWIVDVMSDIGGFISIEPLLEDVSNLSFRGINWLIIGALTGAGAKKFQPKREWVENIIIQADELEIPVFLKNSLCGLLPLRYKFPLSIEKWWREKKIY